MLTIIPFFREIVISAFECPHCHFKNTGIQSASQIASKGIRYELRVKGKEVRNPNYFLFNSDLGSQSAISKI